MFSVDSAFTVTYHSTSLAMKTHMSEAKPQLENLTWISTLPGQRRSNPSLIIRNGRVPEWLKGTGCKPVGSAYLGSNPSAPTISLEQAEYIDGKESRSGCEGAALVLCPSR